jgi:hypothetical protein
MLHFGLLLSFSERIDLRAELGQLALRGLVLVRVVRETALCLGEVVPEVRNLVLGATPLGFAVTTARAQKEERRAREARARVPPPHGGDGRREGRRRAMPGARSLSIGSIARGAAGYV